jgi:hypothetical protein
MDLASKQRLFSQVPLWVGASFDANVPPSPAGLVASAAVPAGVAQRQ